ncbi:hypothetical protein [Schleiferilactobacillus perolens]|jgi:hypothetical protein|uniref:hypothetical protein n=1 Tax=Schleiferilactobacillus perolens TaxID=100468 RepID=UPI002357FABF|nr:hypothetical protein [Schleiferilactobacillus perolens]MCI2172217.1 hypothetical protein [Schleiferilactobacillus perolens]
MKQFIRVISLCLLGLVFLSGCDLPGQFVGKNPFAARTSTSAQHISAKTASVKKTSPKAVVYTDASAQVTQKIHFAFKAEQDETAGLKVGVFFIVTMTVKNESNTPIIFDSSKFIMSGSDWPETIRSAKSKKIQLNPGNKTIINNLFEKVGGQTLEGPGVFAYLNRQHPLAYVYNSFKPGGVTSDNLKDPKLIKLNTLHQSTQSSSASGYSDSSSDSSSTDADNTNDENSDNDVDTTDLTQDQLLAWVRADLESKGWNPADGKVNLKYSFEGGEAIVRVYGPMAGKPNIQELTHLYLVNADGDLQVSDGDGNFTTTSTPYPDN